MTGIFFFLSPAFAHATVYTLTDGNSSVQIDGASQAGLFDWVIDGQDQAKQQWFWYRVGSSGPESSIDTIGPASAVQSDPSHLSLTYTASQFSIQIVYSLLGGSFGSGASDLSEQVNISNPSQLSFHFFQYSDLDLNGTAGADSVSLGKNLQNKFNEAMQSEGSAVLAEVVAPGATHGEAGISPATLNSLNDGSATTLNDSATSAGPGDVTWAFQWDLSSTSILLSKDLNISGVAVPEPATASLFVSAIVAFGLWRNHRKR